VKKSYYKKTSIFQGLKHKKHLYFTGYRLKKQTNVDKNADFDKIIARYANLLKGEMEKK
jgi:hypothetical protein